MSRKGDLEHIASELRGLAGSSRMDAETLWPFLSEAARLGAFTDIRFVTLIPCFVRHPVEAAPGSATTGSGAEGFTSTVSGTQQTQHRSHDEANQTERLHRQFGTSLVSGYLMEYDELVRFLLKRAKPMVFIQRNQELFRLYPGAQGDHLCIVKDTRWEWYFVPAMDDSTIVGELLLTRMRTAAAPAGTGSSCQGGQQAG